MKFSVGLGLALVALAKNFLRSALAMVGLVIGVAAVLTMVALGRGAQEEVTEEVSSAGTNLVFVRAGNYTRGGDAVNMPSGYGKATTLSVDDAAVLAGIEGVEHMVPEVDERAPLRSGEATGFAPVLGCGASHALVHGVELLEGRFFGEQDVASRSAVAVVARATAEKLFRGKTALGRELLIRDAPYVVIGVAETADETQNETVFVPFSRLQDALEIDYLNGVTLAAETAGATSGIAEQVRTLLRARHGLDDPQREADLPQASGIFARVRRGEVPDDFTVRTQAARALTKGLYTGAAAFVLASMPRLDEVTSEEMASTLARANRTMTLLLASLAAVSLVVGGIGIMNVMLLSVTERTTEVGLRMSVGARSRDVLLQFLLEAISLSLAGGLVGIIAGFGAASAITRILSWPTEISATAVGMAFALAFAVGVLFGFYPAYRASRLDPIDALRYE